MSNYDFQKMGSAPVSPIATQETASAATPAADVDDARVGRLMAAVEGLPDNYLVRVRADDMRLLIAAFPGDALSSAERRIEELVRERDGWKAEARTQQTANNLYREAMDERNTFKNAARAAEAQVAALTEQVRKLREALEDQPEAGDDDFYQLGWRHAMERCRAALSPTEPEAMEKT